MDADWFEMMESIYAAERRKKENEEKFVEQALKNLGGKNE